MKNYSTELWHYLSNHLSQSQTKTFALSFEGKGCVAVDEHLSMAARPLTVIPWENQAVHQWEWDGEPDIES